MDDLLQILHHGQAFGAKCGRVLGTKDLSCNRLLGSPWSSAWFYINVYLQCR